MGNSRGVRRRDILEWTPALIAVGIVLRLGFLWADSFWLDEAYSVTVVGQHTVREIWHGSVDPNHPPLFFVILRAALQLAGTSEWTARLPSALASVSSLGLLFLLARRLGADRRVAGAAAVLLALAPLDVWYAQDARMYAMVATAALALAIALTIDSWIGAVLIAAALTIGLYLDFTTVPLSAALISLWVVHWWHSGRQPARLALVAAACTAAWLAFIPRWAHLGEVLGRIDTVPLFVRVREVFGLRLPAGLAAIAVVILIVFAIGSAGAVSWRAAANGRPRERWKWFVWAGFLAATALFAVPRGYSAKQFLTTGWPFVVLFVAWTLREANGPGAHYPSRLARMRLPIMIAVSLVSALMTVATPRADWRGVVSYLNGREARTRVVWLDPPWNVYAYNYYRPAITAMASPISSGDSFEPDAPPGDICVVSERFGKAPPTSSTEAWLDRHLRLAGAVPFARLEVRCYDGGSR